MKAWFKAHKGQIILNLITILIIGSMLTIYGVKAASQRQALPGGFNPGVFSYQGYLSDKNGQPLTGEYPMVFRLYDQPTGGTVLWEEYREGPNQVPVIDGQVNLMLGNITPIPESVWGYPQLYLGIVVGQDTELTPRTLISAVPFAFKAKVADLAFSVAPDSITSAEILDGSLTQSDAPSLVESVNYNNLKIIGSTQVFLDADLDGRITVPYPCFEHAAITFLAQNGHYEANHGQVLAVAEGRCSSEVILDGPNGNRIRINWIAIGY